MSGPTLEAIEVTTEDRWTLRGDRRGAGPAVVVLGHAMLVDRRTLDRPRGGGLASALAEAGLEVLTFDARGHGESGPGADLGASFTYDDVVRFDVPAMVSRARAVAEGRPVVIVGHSLVGHAALIHAGLARDEGPDGIVALAPNLWAPHLEPSRLRRVEKAALLRAWSTVTRTLGYFDPRPLSLGTTPLARAYVEQFVAMWARDRLSSPDGRVDYEDALARLRTPSLALSSDNDPFFAHPEAVARFLALAEGAPLAHRVLRGGPTHMGFVTSKTSAPLWAELAAWIHALARDVAPLTR